MPRTHPDRPLRFVGVGARVTLAPAAVTVVPGAEATVEVRVHNNGSVVDEFTIEVVGDAAAWSRVTPPSLNLFPGSDGTATVTFRPPASADVAAGQVPFGVRVQSNQDPSGSVTEEGTVDVSPYVTVGVDVVPRTSRGRHQMRHEVAVDNHGNSPVTVALSASDPDQHLAFEVEPASMTVGPGEAVFAKLRVRAVTKNPSGPPMSRPFQVVAASPEGEAYAVAQAMAVQDPARPRWLKRALLWTLLGLVAAGLLWATLLKPTVESAAREAVEEEETPATIGPGGGGSGSGSGSGGDGSDDAPSDDGDAGGVVAGAGRPIDGRLFVTASGSTDFTVPDGQTLQLTDIVLQNPSGSTGLLRIQRDDAPLLVVELANFRDLDYHFVAPIVFNGGQRLVLSAECSSPTCNPGAYFAGFISG